MPNAGADAGSEPRRGGWAGDPEGDRERPDEERRREQIRRAGQLDPAERADEGRERLREEDEEAEDRQADAQPDEAVAVLAGGCFWLYLTLLRMSVAIS